MNLNYNKLLNARNLILGRIGGLNNIKDKTVNKIRGKKPLIDTKKAIKLTID